MAMNLSRSDLQSFKKCCISSAVDGTDDMFTRRIKGMGMLGVWVRKMKH